MFTTGFFPKPSTGTTTTAPAATDLTGLPAEKLDIIDDLLTWKRNQGPGRILYYLNVLKQTLDTTQTNTNDLKNWRMDVVPPEYAGLFPVSTASAKINWGKVLRTDHVQEGALHSSDPSDALVLLKNLDLRLLSYASKDSLSQYVSSTGMAQLITEMRSLINAVQKRMNQQLLAYHLGTTPAVHAPYQTCDACWVMTDASFTALTYPSSLDYTLFDGQNMVIGDYTTRRFSWREWLYRRGDRSAVGAGNMEIEGYGKGDPAIPNSGLTMVQATATQPRGIRIGESPGPAKLLLTRTRPTAHTFMVAFSAVRGQIWWVRLGIGQLWFLAYHNGFGVQRWARQGEAVDTGMGIYDVYTKPWTGGIVRAVGMSVDTVNNKLAFIGDDRVYEYESPTSNYLYDFTTNPTQASVGFAAVTLSEPIVNPHLTEVNFAKWKNGTFLGNDGVTRELGPDPVAWDPSTNNQWVLGMGALDNWETLLNVDMTFYEVRAYDRYLNRTELAAEWNSIRQSASSRTDPPTPLPIIT